MTTHEFSVGRKKLEKALGGPVEWGDWREGVDYRLDEEGGLERALFTEEAYLRAKRDRLASIVGEPKVIEESKPQVMKECLVGRITRMFPNVRFVEVDGKPVMSGRFCKKLRVGLRVLLKENVIVGVC